MCPADLSPTAGDGLQVSSVWSFTALSRPSDAGSEARDATELRRSGLFDAAHYLAGGPEPEDGLDPCLHYLREGWRHGRQPNPYFDPAWYLAENRDVREHDSDPLLHYIRYGESEGRRPILHFDPAWYRTTYAVPPAESCLRHFLTRRHSGEVSPLPEFDSAFYLHSYPDVARAGMDPLEHYLVQGFKEARNPSPQFDTRFYRLRYLRDAQGENPLLHYLRHRDQPGMLLSRPADETSIPREIRRNTKPGPAFETLQSLPAGAPRRAMVLAYYLPQFHPVAENDAWWGSGFTEWTNLPRGVPRFAGHYQPRIPRDLGHYRLEGTDTLRRQVALAQGAGLAGFVFYFYWFDAHRLLEKPLEAFLADPTIDFPFCLMWANENWTRQWDGSEQEVLIRQHYRSEDELALIATFARHFADPRYIRLQGRPLLMIYRPGAIPDATASLRRWRLMFRDLHGEDPIFVMSQVFGDADPGVFGMDGAIEFPPHKLVEGAKLINHGLAVLDDEFSAQVYAYDDVAEQALAAPPTRFPLIRTVIPGWDNDARRQGAGLVVHGATPGSYQAWLERTIRQAQFTPFFGTPLVCINAWNEWAEGAYLEPDMHFGAAFLNATGRAIAGMATAGTAGRLLLVGHDAFPAGAQLLLLHIGRTLLRRHGMRIEFLLRDGGTLLSDYEAVAPVTVPADEAELDRFLSERRAGGIRAAIVNTSLAAPLCVRLERLGIACTLLVHELPRLLDERNLTKAAGAGATAASHVVFAATDVRDRFARATGLTAESTIVVRQGSYRDTSFAGAARNSQRAALGIADDTILAVGLGYADLRKGFDLFLQVWRAVQRRDRRVHLIWVGSIDPTMRSYLGEEIAAAAASGTFHFTGWRDDVAELLSAADVMLLTSREDPFPAVALEALAAGLPVIAFEGGGGVPELLRRHAAGVAVPMADAEAMAACLADLGGELRRAPAEARRLPCAATIRREHDFATYAGALLHLAQPALRPISVIVPSYNYAQYLAARLASIFTQTYPVAEIIVLDDASRDGSAAVARSTAELWQRDIAVLENAVNSGSVFEQWRRGAELASGDYVWIAEADDGSEPQFLERLVDAMSGAGDVVMACCDSRCIDADDRPTRGSYRDYYAASAGIGALANDDLFSATGFARRFLTERNLVMNVSAVLWRRTDLLEALARCADDLANYRVAGDWRIYLEILAESRASVAYVASPLNVHRRHDESVTHRLPWGRHVDEIAAMQSLAARRLGIDRQERQRQARYLRELRQPNSPEPASTPTASAAPGTGVSAAPIDSRPARRPPRLTPRSGRAEPR